MHPEQKLPEQPAAAPQDAPPANLIRQQKGNPSLWEVRLRSNDESHWVERLDGFYLPVGATHLMVCSCDHEVEPSSSCIHERALEIHLLQQGEKAQARRLCGLAYSGLRVEEGANLSHRRAAEPQVSVWEGDDANPLNPKPSQALRNHSPDGFEWGYAGSGPAQLALAMLLDYTGDAATAMRHYQTFKAEFIAGLPRESGSWRITGAQIQRFLFRDLRGTTFPYAGFRNASSRCYLHWIARPQHVPDGQAKSDDSVIVIASEMDDNPGMSVTNRAERLANHVCRELEIAPERLIWLEHYQGKNDCPQWSQERFRLVAFHLADNRLHAPRWLPVSRNWVENLIGQSLPPLPEAIAAQHRDI
jgi:hypothetical protein